MGWGESSSHGRHGKQTGDMKGANEVACSGTNVRTSLYFSGLQLQFSYTVASGRKPLVQPALLLGPPAVGQSVAEGH
mgnify:CR=1 FL=1